jgi:hypothetical protein
MQNNAPHFMKSKTVVVLSYFLAYLYAITVAIDEMSVPLPPMFTPITRSFQSTVPERINAAGTLLITCESPIAENNNGMPSILMLQEIKTIYVTNDIATNNRNNFQSNVENIRLILKDHNSSIKTIMAIIRTGKT